MKKFCMTMACIFGVATIVLYIVSINKLDKDTARVLGTSTTINIQGTVFCAATAIMCVINAVGAMILGKLEDIDSACSFSSRSTSDPQLSKMKDFKMSSLSTENKNVVEPWVCKKCGTRNTEYKNVCKKCYQSRL